MSSITKAGKELRTVVSLAGYTKNAFVSLVFGWIVKVGLCAPKSIATKIVGAIWENDSFFFGLYGVKGN